MKSINTLRVQGVMQFITFMFLEIFLTPKKSKDSKEFAYE